MKTRVYNFNNVLDVLQYIVDVDIRGYEKSKKKFDAKQKIYDRYMDKVEDSYDVLIEYINIDFRFEKSAFLDSEGVLILYKLIGHLNMETKNKKTGNYSKYETIIDTLKEVRLKDIQSKKDYVDNMLKQEVDDMVNSIILDVFNKKINYIGGYNISINIETKKLIDSLNDYFFIKYTID